MLCLKGILTELEVLKGTIKLVAGIKAIERKESQFRGVSAGAN